MRTLPTFIALGFAALFVVSPAAAACYEDQVVSATIECGENASNSADFGGSCTDSVSRVVSVKVECPVVVVTPPKTEVTKKPRPCTGGNGNERCYF